MRDLLMILMLGITTLCFSYDGNQYVQECNEDYSSCSVKVITNHNETIDVLEDYPFYSTIVQHDEDIVQITANCGSPCQTYIFVNLKTSDVEYIDNPVKYSNELMMVAYIKDGSLELKKIFDKKVVSFKEINFSPVANINSAIKKFKFISKNEVEITYLSTKDFIKKTELIEF